jgi:hypothetical protein
MGTREKNILPIMNIDELLVNRSCNPEFPAGY